jgi:hypothetical protein
LIEREAPAREPVVRDGDVLTQGLTTSVIELPAVADTYIASEWPDQSFGADALYLGYNLLEGEDHFGAERILLRFDVLNNLPAGAVINDAQLWLRLNWAYPADDAPMGTVVRRLASAWEESTVTWNREPEWAETRTTAYVSSTLGWYEWDLTALVQGWAAGTYENYGIEVIGDERVQQRERAFYARETSTDFFPRLVIDYTDDADTQPPDVRVDPLPDYVVRSFSVSWGGEDPGGSGIASYDVQYRINGGTWTDWLVDVTFDAADFMNGQNARVYAFRARGEDYAGNVEAFGKAQAVTTVDAQAPTAAVAPLPSVIGTTSFPVSWSGSDEGSGIQHYDVRYRIGDNDWVLWQSQTTATSATFTAPGDGLYAFEARATDHLGLQETYTGQPETSTIVDAEPPFVQPKVWIALALVE